MTELDLISQLLKSNGVAGVIAVFLLWDKFIRPMQKKSKGEWIDHNSVRKEFTDIQKELTALSVKIEEMEKRRKDDSDHNYNQHANLFGRVDKLEDKAN